MLKIRLQGTIQDIHWFKKFLESQSEFNIIEMSDIFSNKGTNKYYRSYVEIEKFREKGR